MPIPSVRTLLSNVIDYAGLFPPAKLDMKTAVEKYLQYSRGDHAWMLGLFICPADRLEELRWAADGEAIPVSVLIGSDLEREAADAQAIEAKAIEVKAATPTQIRTIASQLSGDLTTYIEIPIDRDPMDSLRAIADTGTRAKIRTGGLTPESFPGSRNVARFLDCCSESNVEFKATAGLHHPMRSTRALTADPAGPTAVMHGFLNVFVAAAFVRAGLETGDTVRLLEETSADKIKFEDSGITWRDHHLDIDQLVDARRNLAIGFGSCSFEEPVTELQALGML